MFQEKKKTYTIFYVSYLLNRARDKPAEMVGMAGIGFSKKPWIHGQRLIVYLSAGNSHGVLQCLDQQLTKIQKMKKAFLLLGFSLVVLAACEKEEKEEPAESTATIVGTWKAERTSGFEYNQTTMDTVFTYDFPIGGVSSFQITFDANGTATVVDEGDTETGTYVYANNQLTLSYDGDVEVFQVSELTATTMVWLQTETYTDNGETFYAEDKTFFGK